MFGHSIAFAEEIVASNMRKHGDGGFRWKVRLLAQDFLQMIKAKEKVSLKDMETAPLNMAMIIVGENGQWLYRSSLSREPQRHKLIVRGFKKYILVDELKEVLA